MKGNYFPKDLQPFFDEIVTKIKDTLDPDFILIAGSFGKESWLYSKDELISDFEFVFVCKKTWSFYKKKKLLKSLNKEYSYDINLKGYLSKRTRNKVISNYTSKNPGYISLDFFDTFSDPKFLYIRIGETLDVDCDVNEVPVWEAWRLYTNRMGDLLKLEYLEKASSKISDYHWLKIFESTADAYCIINRIYSKNISKRDEIFSQELIENDNELNEICKNSYAIIKQALRARNNHSLSFFANDLSVNERKRIVISWMKYFEKKLTFQEKLSGNDDFYCDYLNTKDLQKKYLGFNYRFNILISNTIRLIHNPKLFHFKFKFYRHDVSWRHIVLLTISNIFKEDYNALSDLSNSKKILSRIIQKKYLKNQSKKEFVLTTVSYWKYLC